MSTGSHYKQDDVISESRELSKRSGLKDDQGSIKSRSTIRKEEERPRRGSILKKSVTHATHPDNVSDKDITGSVAQSNYKSMKTGNIDIRIEEESSGSSDSGKVIQTKESKHSQDKGSDKRSTPKPEVLLKPSSHRSSSSSS